MELQQEYHPSGDDFEVICIGGMGADFFKARGIQPIYELRGLASQPSFDEVHKIISKPLKCIKMNFSMSSMFATTTT